jgi:hypothetical protein
MHYDDTLTLCKNDISQFVPNIDSAPPTHLCDMNEVILKSDEIRYYALLCMIYRATPTSANSTYDPVVQSVKYAREGLDCHGRCIAAFKSKTELWAMYLHW